MPVSIVSPQDFSCRHGGTVDPAVVLDRANMSLYCLDPVNREALFVETPADLDLSAAPFLFQTQFSAAQRLVAVSYADFLRLASQVAIDPRRLVLIFSVGRCGSTLVSRAFDRSADGIESLSEPDVFSQLLKLRAPDGSNSDEIRNLLRACTLLQCAPSLRSGATAWVLKFRSITIELAPVFLSLFPGVSVIFLYRDVESWARSEVKAFDLLSARMLAALPLFQSALNLMAPRVGEFSARNTRPITVMELLACRWLSIMECFMELQQQGPVAFTARYQDMRTDPHAVLSAMFAHCGLPAPDRSSIDALLARDSQADSPFSRAAAQQAVSELNLEHLEELRRFMLATAPLLPGNVVVPGTFTLTPKQ